jgi:hypothetical protein
LKKTPLKGFTQVLISFTYYQRKGSIQPLPEGQRYNLPLDPSAIKDEKKRYKFVLAKNFMAMLSPIIAKICYEYGFYGSIFERRDEKEIMDFVKEIPTFYVLFNLSYWNENNYRRHIDRNDLYDISSLSIAIPYCDIVVAEKYFTSIARRAKLDEIYKKVILTWSSIDELENHL